VTIRKGEAWGQAVTIPAGLVELSSNAALAECLGNGPPKDPLLVTGGDLGRTLGIGPRSPAPGSPGTALPIDLIRVEAGERVTWAALHVVARRGWWRGGIVAAMNVQFLGDWDVTPRAHPNDGKLDLIEVDVAMSAADRWKARQRLSLGTHIPHPSIRVRQMSTAAVSLESGMSLYIDGTRWAVAPSPVTLQVVADACTVIVAAGVG
jgi:YegS C-terminal NAD kinase beta sandwich-like domain